MVVPALLAYVPLLLTRPGAVGADTKTYLYLDPAALLRDAPWVWDSQIGLGTVTHQNIGYLFPMGPFYLLFDAIGAPDWVAQRLWLGSVLFGAALGVRFLLRTVAWGTDRAHRGALLVAMLAYMCSPYFLAYAARISVILLPWAALGWLIGLTARALERGGWRDPAWFACVVLVVGGINATALLLIGFGPLLWLVWAVAVDRTTDVRSAVATTTRIGILTVATSLWWIGGLWAEGRYGLPVIRYTETYKTVAEVSNAPEVLRGLGYWFFYGNDKLGPWIEPSAEYTNRIPLIALSYGVPILALAAAASTRWRHRSYFLALGVVGALVAIGAHPWEAPSVVGGVFKAFTRTDAGLSLRSTPRAVPLVVLATSVSLGSAVAAISRRLPALAAPASATVCVLVVANLPPMWTGALVADNLKRDEHLPTWWHDAASWLDARPHSTRVLEIPGADFASYRWGNTVDPVTPGLMERPYVARELFQWGSPQSADLLNAFDRRLQESTIDAEAIAPISRLLGVGDVVARNDLQYERYRVARPRLLGDLLDRAPGLGDPTRFGPDTPNVAGPEQTMVDEVELGTPVALAHPAAVTAFPVEDPQGIVRTHPATHPLLVAGDGEGIVDAASIGLLDPDQALFSAAWFADDPVAFDRVYSEDADLLVTDTDRRRAHRWGALREITGYTERAGESPVAYDPTDQRLEVFPAATDDDRTVTELRARLEAGIDTAAVVTASGYGNPITYTPDDRPALALDGDPATAWRVGAIDEVVGEHLTIELAQPVTTDTINLVQPITLERTRWITEARLRFDDGAALDITLDDRSRAETAEGQTVDLGGSRTFSRLEIEVLDTNIGRRPRYDGVSGVGFAEVRIPGVGVEEVVRPPVTMLDRAGASSADHRLAYLFTRLRSNPAEPVRGDEEESLRRVVRVPTDRTFRLAGQARLSPLTAGDALDTLLGVPGHHEGGVTVTAGRQLPGSLRHRPSAALDGDPSTAWTNTYQQQSDAYLEIRTATPVTFDRLDLRVVADGRHSVPTRLRVESATGGATPVPVAGIDLPFVVDGATPDAVTEVPVRLDNPVTGDHFLVVVETVRQVPTRDWYSNLPTITPIAIAEVGIPGVQVEPPPARFDSGCRDDLVTIDGEPLPVRITGDTAVLVDRGAATVSPCGTSPVSMTAGDHVLRTTPGRSSGLDIDRLVLASDAGGDALGPGPLAREVEPGPTVRVDDDGRASTVVTITGATEPFWLVLGQSWSDGWHATVDGTGLGAPVLADGFGNGWLVTPPSGEPFSITMEWAPQRVVWFAIAASAVAVIACLALLVVGRRRPAGVAATGASGGPFPELVWPLATVDPVLPRRTTAVVLAAVGVAGALLLPWRAGLVLVPPLTAVTIAACRWPRGRSVAAVTSAMALAAAGAYIVVQQHRHRFPPDFAWPTEFDRVHPLGLAAVALLAVQVIRDVLDQRRAEPARRANLAGTERRRTPDTPDTPDTATWSADHDPLPPKEDR